MKYKGSLGFHPGNALGQTRTVTFLEPTFPAFASKELAREMKAH